MTEEEIRTEEDWPWWHVVCLSVVVVALLVIAPFVLLALVSVGRP